MDLNNKQEEAKNKIEGSLLIIAGAGTGKTATLDSRVKYMIKEKGIKPYNILLLTFTNKAAKEMQTRICKSLGIDYNKQDYYNENIAKIGTFHSFGIFLIKECINKYDNEELNINLKKNFIIYDENDKISILKSIIKEKLNLDEKQYPAKQIAFFISNAKNILLSAKGYEKEADTYIKEIVYKVYIKYEEILKQNNAIDFDDILLKTLNLLQKAKILDFYQERYKYIMIDEYQDTNLAQYEIVKLLANKYKNLAVVGDDSQSIYSWRGANMNNILNFKKDYKDAQIIKLEQNYRSTKNILKGANSIIKNNTSGIKKELWTENENGNKIIYIEAITDKIEASTIANIISEQYQEGIKYSKNLILYRTNAQSRQIEESLILRGIAYRIIGGLKFYDRKEIKDILGYLKIIYNIYDILSLKRIINTPSRKIGGKLIEKLDNYSNLYGLNYIQILENLDEINDIKSSGKTALKNFYNIYIELLNKSTKLKVSELIKEIIKITSYEEFILDGLNEEEKQSKRDNINELINLATEYDSLEAHESLSKFLEEIALITDLDKEDKDNDYVKLMTIHSSKGLEEEIVFLAGLEEGIFPSFKSINNKEALEEERRLMYVAMTRAKKQLYISRAKERFNFGEYTKNPESRFMKEIDSNYIENYTKNYNYTNDNLFKIKIENNNYFSTNKNTNFISKIQNNDISQFKTGDNIEHQKFGIGKIIDIIGEVAQISFPNKGLIKMNIRIASIKKI